MIIGFLMIWSLMFGAQAEPKIGTYGFVHHETTGITSSVIVKGVERRIQFHRDSDPVAVKALNALSWKIVLPNSDGKKLFLVGQYYAAPKQTAKCDGCSTVEEYREFKLLSWYIVTPFKVVRDDCENCAYLREENLRTRRRLEREDFQDFDGKELLDVSRFQREKRTVGWPRRATPTITTRH